jgi:hypothetical protein
MLVVSVLGLLLAEGGMTVKAQNQKVSSPTKPNSITITPELINQIGGPMYAVAWQDNYAYVGVGPRLYILDVSNPAQPVFTGRTGVLPEVVQDVAVSGDYAYITSFGFRIIDISDPAAPKEIGACSTPGRALGVAVSGNFAYVADDNFGLRIIDVSNPSVPIEVGFYGAWWLVEIADPYTHSIDVAVSGNYAYITNNYEKYSWLEIVDITNPAAPVGAGSVVIPGHLMAVAVAGDYAYIAAKGSGLHIIDISNPAEAVDIGFLDTIGVEDVVVVGKSAYITEEHRFTIVDVSNPEAPASVGYYDTTGYTQGLAVAGNYAFLANNLTGLHIIDISNPTAPAEAGSYTTPIPDSAQGVMVVGKYAYVADDLSGLHIIDITDPVVPREVGFFDTPGRALDVVVAGSYAYIADFENGLRIIDISNPAAPTEVGFFDSPYYGVWEVAVAGSHAYLNDDQGGFYIIDISDPTMPTQIGFYGNYYGSLYDVTVVGNYAYAAAEWGGLRIIDISDPYAPTETGFFYTAVAFGLEVVGNHAYLAAGSLRIIDISNPSAPIEIGSCDLPGDDVAEDVVVAGDYAYVFSITRGIYIIDISDPTTPTTVGLYENPNYVYDMAVAGNYAYFTYIDKGLFILRLQTDKVIDSVPITGGDLVSSDGNTNLIFPSGAFSQTVNITYRQMLNDEHIGYWAGIDHSFDVSAVYSDTGETANLAPSQTFTITVAYSDSEIGPALEDTLGLFSWNDTTWAKEPTSTLDPVNNIITATPNHLSLWAVLGGTNRVFLPMARK